MQDRVERIKYQKLNQHASEINLKRLDASEIRAADIRLGGGRVADGYAMDAPVIDTPVYTKWLRKQVLAPDPETPGTTRVTIVDPAVHTPVKTSLYPRYPSRITDRLSPQEDLLRDMFDVDAIVNCTGLGAAELAGAAMIPLRGALVKIPREQFVDGGPTEAYAMAKTHFQQDMVFVVPRENEVMLGGIAEPGEYDTRISWDYQSPNLVDPSVTSKPILDMYRRCMRFLGEDTLKPEVRNHPAEHLKITAGLRPYRAENVALEREHGFNIVHNYGHSGSGFSFSYGCAEEAVDLIQSMEGTAFHTPYPVA